MDPRTVIARRVRRQATGCADLGSPLYAGLLDRLAGEVEAGGAALDVLEPFAAWPGDTVYALRLMGSVHRRVLSGRAPELAPHFVPGGDPAAAWPPFARLIAAHVPELRAMVRRQPVQTNEVGRCAALAPAILWLSGGKPVRLLEIGASAGLNLRWGRYRYEDAWGDPDSAVQLRNRYAGHAPPFRPSRLTVLGRRGCDAAPVDPATDDGALTLRSFVWPDQRERLELLDGALRIAREVPVAVDSAPASVWLRRMLDAEPPPGCTTVVFHSIVWQYLDAEERTHVTAVLAEAGERASADSPLAWLRMEPDGNETAVQATTWPGGATQLLARSGFHGRPVTWLAPTVP